MQLTTLQMMKVLPNTSYKPSTFPHIVTNDDQSACKH